jgi:Holliday junction resolvasome RuvABC endonuclease subunit
MNILALDLGTFCGWALQEAGRIDSGVQIFDLKRGESPGMRFVRFRRWLDEIAAKVDVVVFEAAHHRGGAATAVASGFAAHVMTYCAERNIQHASVHTATLKKYATGSGRADKAAVLEAVRRRWKAEVVDDNEADALALLHYALQELV